ncbi:MAG TPA: HNH endonuclease signature motif containing protein, partial [Gammaproteobacteria bacterium]|nr:HNH endonuclease signature motif containing protein [Gammaproteobacteria bacterium]
ASAVGIVRGRDGDPLDIGRKSRAIPVAIERALRARDGGCRFPGCDRTRFTQGHHIKHWIDGGETKLKNLVLLCRFHHTLIHEGGYGVSATDDGLFVFTRPDGGRIPDAGRRFRGNVASDDTAPGICVQNRDAGLSIDAKTGRCKWLGERMDYSQAIEGMQFRRDRALEAEQASRET